MSRCTCCDQPRGRGHAAVCTHANRACSKCTPEGAARAEATAAVKRAGRKIKDLQPGPTGVLRRADLSGAERARVALRFQQALEEADDVSRERARGLEELLCAWAESPGGRAELESILGRYRGYTDRVARARNVDEALRGLGALKLLSSHDLNDSSVEMSLLDRTGVYACVHGACARLPAEHLAVVKEYVRLGGEHPQRSCEALTRFLGAERLRRRARAHELACALRCKGMLRRKDSALCDAFVDGTAGRTAFQVAETMARFRFLYSGSDPEFNRQMDAYCIRAPSGRRWCDDFDDFDSSDEDYVESDVTFVSRREYNRIRKRLAERWTRFPRVWPWLHHKVRKVQLWWRALIASPYTAVGKRRLCREFEDISATLVTKRHGGHTE